MKARRQARIMELIRSDRVATQAELAETLRREGFSVTQATISRDIRELGLVKVPHEGGYRYAPPDRASAPSLLERLRRFFRDSVVSLDASENLVVVKTLPGTAGAVAEAIDRLDFEDIVGTLAGENTILVVVRSKRQVPGLLARFEELWK